MGERGDGSPQGYRDAASDVIAAVEALLPRARATPIGTSPWDVEVTVADDVVVPRIVDPDVVPALGYGVDDEALQAMESGGVLLVPAGPGEDDAADVRVERRGEVTTGRVVTFNVFSRVGQPSREALMTPATAARLSIPLAPTQVLVDVPGTLTTAQEEELDGVLTRVAPGSFVYTERGYENTGLTTAVRVLVLAAVLVVVLGTLTATALAIIDTRRERDLLAAAGASPRTGRGVGAATAIGYAGTGALVGAVLGVLLGLIFALRTVPDARGRELVVDPVVVLPWVEIAVLVVVLPLALGAVTWLVARGGSALAGAREASRV